MKRLLFDFELQDLALPDEKGMRLTDLRNLIRRNPDYVHRVDDEELRSMMQDLERTYARQQLLLARKMLEVDNLRTEMAELNGMEGVFRAVQQDRPVTDILPRARARLAMRRGGIETVGQLCRLSYEDLMKIRLVSESVATDIKESLERVGLTLRNEPSLCPSDHNILDDAG